VRLPFYFGQIVHHKDWPEMDFFVIGMTLTPDNSWSVNVSEHSGGFWIFPAYELKADLGNEQEAMAKWMGCSVETMNMDHDKLHQMLADLLRLPSLSLIIAKGKRLSQEETALACLEEDAVLHLQRYIVGRAKSGR
jgi:hypothetical protein